MADNQFPTKTILGLILVFLVGFVGYTGYQNFYKPIDSTDDQTSIQPTTARKEDTGKPVVGGSKFANFPEVKIDIVPALKKYSVKDNLSNVDNAEEFSYLSNRAKSKLVENQFVVVPGYSREFFSLYELNRYDQTPNFITTDSILHNYHLMFNHLLENLEKEKLTPILKELNLNMVDLSQQYYDQLKGTEWENAAKRTLGFFAVGSKLLDPKINVPGEVADLVDQELALIDAHEEIEASPVMNIGSTEESIIETPQGLLPLEKLKEDYTQYIPRGHYDKSELLKQYFKSMMWFGRLTFRFKNPDEIKSGLLINLALNQNDNLNKWEKIYQPTSFFVGVSDDIDYYQFNDLAEQFFGQDYSLLELKDKNRFDQFVEAIKELDPPQVNSIPIFEARIQSDREEEIKGFRFMGQRFTLDASVFQRLVYREVGDKKQNCQNYNPQETGCLNEARCLPMGLDIPAAMGSGEALNILEEKGETDYACYSENINKMREYISGLDEDIWTQNLYWGWLYSLKPLAQSKPEGYPSFMLNNNWLRKGLNTYLGSWTELKHDTILYAKQVYAELGAGGFPEEKDDRGYVEPEPLVYGRLKSLLAMTRSGLSNLDILGAEDEKNLILMEELVEKLKIISEKELSDEKLTAEDYELIRTYGGQLEHIWYEVNKKEMEEGGMTSMAYLEENPAAIVADVATDPNGLVLEEGTGYIDEIYVVVPVEGQLKIAKGGVYSYYEFTWPMSDRLTDKKWRQILKNKEALDRPFWVNNYLIED